MIDVDMLEAAIRHGVKIGKRDAIINSDIAIELITRLREAEKDAARYRWLRDAPATSASEPIRHWMWSRPYGANMKYLDDAIDQAMKEKGDE